MRLCQQERIGHELGGRGTEASSQQCTVASHSNLVFHEQVSGGPALPDEDPVAQDMVTVIFQAIEDGRRPWRWGQR